MKERLMQYFEEGRSVRDFAGNNIEQTLKVIATRYMGCHPPHPFGFHVFQYEGFHCQENGQFDLNLLEKLPDSKWGQSALIRTRFFKEYEGEQTFFLSCYGPVAFSLNEEIVYRSSVREEVNVQIKKEITLAFHEGWNELTIQCRSTASGFGCRIGVTEPRWDWISFMQPDAKRRGKLGFIYSEAYDGDNGSIDYEALKWYPEISYPAKLQQLSAPERIYGTDCHGFVYGWSSFYMPASGDGRLLVTLPDIHDYVIYIDHQPIAVTGENHGRTELPLEAGLHQILIRWQLPFKIGGERFPILTNSAGTPIPWQAPVLLKGTQSDWLYLGVFLQPQKELEAEIRIYKLYGFVNKKQDYWRVDEPCARIRPVLHSTCFGKWNYPLGVTLYGLISTARLLADNRLLEYAAEHIRECVKFYEYAQWDIKEYGYPEINNQLVTMSMLDDCGSFGSAMLELSDPTIRKEVSLVANDIAAHMKHHQERRPDGAFYRECPGHFMENTLWVDDLYMSIPFLCRYYMLSKDDSYLEDAIKQVLLFRSYLFQPDLQLMSHVYDFKYGTDTKMPWGRGNGWCFFSLSELLEQLSETHPKKAELLQFYNQLAKGYLAVQGSRGMWHQLLTHPDSYEETSCTAMFIYGLCRGFRFGWLESGLRDQAWKAAQKAWKAITDIGVDWQGNIHGICGGSAYSFTPEYYKEKLLWIENDPHGIGIVLLAGAEWIKIQSFKEQFDR